MFIYVSHELGIINKKICKINSTDFSVFFVIQGRYLVERRSSKTLLDLLYSDFSQLQR